MRTWLKELRIKNGYTQAYMAEKLGISQQYYSFIESKRKQKDLSLSLAVKLCELFQVPMEFIITEEEK